MLNCFYCFISVLIGFLLSPQFVFQSSNWSDLKHIVCVASFVAVTVGLISQINGFGLRMMVRSRSDFYINIIISLVCGFSIVILVYYKNKIGKIINHLFKNKY